MDAFAHWLNPYLSGGSLLAIPLVILGGLITAFNPCCLPMYPAVFGYIGSGCCRPTTPAAADGRQAAAKPLANIALLFVLGMASATSLMGILTAGLGWVFGHFDSRLLFVLALLPLYLGMNQLGLLPMRLPRWLNVRVDASNNDQLRHRLGAFGAGVVFSLAIAPCTTPILFGILSLVAMRNDLAYGGVLMFCYGLGAGLPLLLIGHGANRLQRLLTSPRRQTWLRRMSGVLLIGVSVYIVLST